MEPQLKKDILKRPTNSWRYNCFLEFVKRLYGEPWHTQPLANQYYLPLSDHFLPVAEKRRNETVNCVSATTSNSVSHGSCLRWRAE